MRLLQRARLHAGAGLLAVTLAACAGGSAPVTPGVAPAAFAQAPQNHTLAQALATPAPDAELFVSAAHNPVSQANEVDVYDAEAPFTFLRRITQGISGPNAMAVDAHGDVFVSNVDNATVEEFGPQSSTPIKVFRTSFRNPLTLAVGDNGTLYAVNYDSIGNGSTIFEIPAGSTAPAVKIHLPGGLEGLAVDDHNNLYAGYNSSTGRILRFAPGSTTGKDLGITLGFAGGVALDNKGNLVACDQTNHVIDIFAPGTTTPMKRLKRNASFSPYQIAFSRDFTRLFVADNASKILDVYSYPGGVLVNQIQRANAAFGVAVDPIGAP